MKRLILAAGLFAATLTASLHAQTINMQASIPFEFRIGSTVLPSAPTPFRLAQNRELSRLVASFR
jgi:hypothetical protein